MKINDFGILYIVSTPLGNLQDMSLRAVDILKQVDRIAAEDTRHSFTLLQHFAIKTPMISLHEYNERERVAQLLERLTQGESIALISDAGTPLISDPGYILVREARAAGIKVVPIPGPCAAIAALSVAGLATDRFVFEGFLPTKSKLRKERLAILSKETRTMIIYEAPHRIVDLLRDLEQQWGGQRKGVIARELTKIYETIYSGTFTEILQWLESDENQQRGEMVVIVEGAQETAAIEKTISTDHVLSTLLASLPLKQAVEIAAEITGQRKNELYKCALNTQSQQTTRK